MIKNGQFWSKMMNFNSLKIRFFLFVKLDFLLAPESKRIFWMNKKQKKVNRQSRIYLAVRTIWKRCLWNLLLVTHQFLKTQNRQNLTHLNHYRLGRINYRVSNRLIRHQVMMLQCHRRSNQRNRMIFDIGVAKLECEKGKMGNSNFEPPIKWTIF